MFLKDVAAILREPTSRTYEEAVLIINGTQFTFSRKDIHDLHRYMQELYLAMSAPAETRLPFPITDGRNPNPW